MEAYLVHHGIKGQKWGVRKYQNPDGSLTPAGKKRYGEGSEDYLQKRNAYKQAKKEYNKSFRKAYNRSMPIHLTKKGRDAETKRWEDVHEKANKLDAAKKASKAAGEKLTKSRVSAYEKSYDKWNSKAEKANAAWRDVKSQYKNLGKTPISRLIETQKAYNGKGSAAAKKYLADYDKASKMSDDADALWRDTKKKFKNVGKTYLQRVIFNIKYGSDA